MSVTEFVIHRAKWARGAGENELLRADGKQCCVGIYLSACGVPDEHLLGLGLAATVMCCGGLPTEAMWLAGKHPNSSSPTAVDLYQENDDKARESEIVRLFASQGITVRFED